MAKINLKRFVDINIKQHVVASTVGTRDTVVLFTAEGTNGTTNLIESIVDANAKYNDKPNTLAYLKVFFENSGVKVLVVEGVGIDNLTADTIKDLDNSYICIAYASESTAVEANYAKIKQLATTRAADSTIYGINEKILLAATATDDTASVKNFAVKYSSVQGAEMTIAAYLTKINVYGVDTVYDYAFTQEVLTAEDLADSKFATVMTNNMNVDINLANSIRNCGGNCKDGADIVNTYVRIILHQTLTDVLIQLLAQKIKNTTGASKIYAVIAQELERYLTSGYLTTDKVWTDKDLTVNYNGVSYTIIEQGTALTNGYVIQVLPFTSLTDADKAAHKAPPVYVVIADQYGIRQITVNGEVI